MLYNVIIKLKTTSCWYICSWPGSHVLLLVQRVLTYLCFTYFGRWGLRSRWMMEVSVRRAADLISTRVGSLSSSSWTSSSRMPGYRRLCDSALEYSRTDRACSRAWTHFSRRLWLENECASRKCVNSTICKPSTLSNLLFILNRSYIFHFRHQAWWIWNEIHMWYVLPDVENQ